MVLSSPSPSLDQEMDSNLEISSDKAMISDSTGPFASTNEAKKPISNIDGRTDVVSHSNKRRNLRIRRTNTHGPYQKAFGLIQEWSDEFKKHKYMDLIRMGVVSQLIHSP